MLTYVKGITAELFVVVGAGALNPNTTVVRLLANLDSRIYDLQSHAP